jgi:lipoprotein NlpI
MHHLRHHGFVLWLVFVSSPILLLAGEEPDAKALYTTGVEQFYAAKPVAAVTAFDALIALAPDSKPQLWQRGIALYYTGEFQKGREQFEVHQTVNPRDVENAAWHFICVAKSDSLDAARKNLIPIAGDARVPMAQIHALFAGTGSEDAVLAAANDPHAGEAAQRNHLCYAHLYLGLYHEVMGNIQLARQHMRKAAIDYQMPHYMGRTAQVHVALRGWDKPSVNPGE